MGKGRLEAFSDGVIAIIIAIMVLEMKVPHGRSPVPQCATQSCTSTNKANARNHRARIAQLPFSELSATSTKLTVCGGMLVSASRVLQRTPRDATTRNPGPSIDRGAPPRARIAACVSLLSRSVVTPLQTHVGIDESRHDRVV